MLLRYFRPHLVIPYLFRKPIKVCWTSFNLLYLFKGVTFHLNSLDMKNLDMIAFNDIALFR